MRVAIVHYHLRPGGVTRVIETTADALGALGIETAVLSGESVPGLGYDETPGPETLAARLRSSGHAAFGAPPDAWIFHNPTLGKNRDLPAAIEQLAREGEAILLHIHDLAEDGRPQNFTNIRDPGTLHFTAPRVHHAFINARDHAAFLAAGLPSERAHLLPNPIKPAAATHLPRDGDALVFYPVRGIRRKNLGEVCLLAVLAPPGTRFAVSLAPENPGELSNHDFWRMFATAQGLPVLFDVVGRIAPCPGHLADFAAWCSHATHWLSTSVAEGFGQTLAEAAARRIPLIARRLDPGFVPSDPRGLYHHIAIPGEAREFSTLDESAQAAAITRILHSPETAAAVHIDGLPARAWLANRLADRAPAPSDPQLAAHAPDAVARRLRDILTTLARQPAAPPIFLPQFYFPGKIIVAPPVPRREFPRAVIFDVYGTLLDGPPGRIRPDPAADAAILSFLGNDLKPEVRQSPSTALAALVAGEHARARTAGEAFPEIDLVALWAGLLDRPADNALASLVAAIEDVWHPATPMPGAADMLRRLAAAGIPCGLLSNAQANVWHQLGPLAPSFARDLCVFSHQFGRAKPSPALFAEISARLARRGISPADAWFVGNDPDHDIAPAKSAGFRTAIFGPRPADADLALHHWADFSATPGK